MYGGCWNPTTAALSVSPYAPLLEDDEAGAAATPEPVGELAGELEPESEARRCCVCALVVLLLVAVARGDRR